MTMRIETRHAVRLAAVRHMGSYQQIASAFQKLGALAGPAGLFAKATGHMMAIYKDDPRTTPVEALRSAAGLPVSDTEVLPAGLVDERVDAGRFACFLHVGPYDTLPGAWAEAIATVLGSGHRRRPGPSLEIYLNDPSTVPPADLQTEIAIPVE